jgi:type I restriction enzyme M protein
MYGQDEINIIYADTLATIPNVKENDYSILVANPPYSVKGFLETLEEKDRKKYQLIETIETKSYPNNNSIETFFIERAKQLLKPDGVMGIIVPSSILTKGKAKSTSKSANIYVATREILIKYFDIIAIAEFGSGTFGKTGTNTVTLFLRRKPENPAPAEHYFNRVNSWFKGEENKDQIFQDDYLIKKYCHHLEFDFDDYKLFLTGEINEQLLNHDIFKEYQKEFDKWTEIKNLKKQRAFKALNKDEQKEELNQRFIAYVQDIEKDKLYYFVLASLNPQKVLIIKSPSKNTEMKEFLGYEWSSAKGNEGIKYLGNTTIEEVTENEEDDSNNLEEEDRRVLSNLFNLANINTPLYDPQNNDNPEKINYLIKQNFIGETVDIPESLSSFVTSAFLVDMLDFSRPDFNKSISLTLKETTKINTKWNLVKIGDVFNIVAGQSPKSENYNQVGNGLPFYQGKKDFGLIYLNKPTVWTTQVTKEANKDDLLISVRAPLGDVNFNPFDKICIGRGLAAIQHESLLLKKYLFEYLVSHQFIFEGYKGATFEAISTDDLRQIKIPLPPLEIQEEIVKACQAIDEEFEKAETIIKSEKEKIENLMKHTLDTFNRKDYQITIGNLTETSSGGTPKSSNQLYYQGGTIPWINSGEVAKGEIYNAEKFITDLGLQNSNAKIFPEETVLLAMYGATAGKCAVLKFKASTNQAICGIFPNNKFISKFLKYQLDFMYEDILGLRHGIARENLSQEIIKNILVIIPPKEKQQEIISEIEKCEEKIKEAQTIINSIAKRKEAVIYQYL